MHAAVHTLEGSCVFTESQSVTDKIMCLQCAGKFVAQVCIMSHLESGLSASLADHELERSLGLWVIK